VKTAVTIPAISASHRKVMERVRQGASLEAGTVFAELIEEDDIAGSFERVVAEVVPVITAGQALAQDVAQAYVVGLVEAVHGEPHDPLPVNEASLGTNRQGQPLAASLAAIGPMILQRIADNGGAPSDPAAQSALERVRGK
jgi:hypothetical protein